MVLIVPLAVMDATSRPAIFTVTSSPTFRRSTEIAVSYTHLDVYKRQVISQPFIEGVAGVDNLLLAAVHLRF